MKQNFLAATALTLCLALSGPAAADPVQQSNYNTVWFENWGGLSNALMRVASPQGEITDVRAERGTPVFQLPGGAADGVWRYELRASTDEMVKNPDYVADSEFDVGEEYMPKSLYRTGMFIVERGVILRPEDMPSKEES